MGGVEGGIGTRRRPIGRDYAAAKDAECGIKRRWGRQGKGESGRLGDGETTAAFSSLVTTTTT